MTSFPLGETMGYGKILLCISTWKGFSQLSWQTNKQMIDDSLLHTFNASKRQVKDDSSAVLSKSCVRLAVPA